MPSERTKAQRYNLFAKKRAFKPERPADLDSLLTANTSLSEV